MLPLFLKVGYDYTILEIWKPNVMWLLRRQYNVIKADVQKMSKLSLGKFDIVMWWHGPEHLEEDRLYASSLKQLQALTGKILITACPWGKYTSRRVTKNPYEEHLSCLYPEFFESLGWATNTIGEKDREGSNLLAWWRKE